MKLFCDVQRTLARLLRMSASGSKFHIHLGRLDLSIKMIIASTLIPTQQDQFSQRVSGLYAKRQLFPAFFIAVGFTAY